jgi:hypothetical protein
MGQILRFFRRVFYILRRDRADADLAEEIAFHQAMLQQRGEGLRAMGNTAISREDARAVWIWPWLESMLQDLAYAGRGFRRQPVFTAVAVLALACAIGLNTSLFTVFNAIALRPWSVPDPGRVVRVYNVVKNPSRGFDNIGGFSYGHYRYLAEHSKSMSGLFMERGEGGLRLEKAKVRIETVSDSYFRVLGIGMQQGRGFLSGEDNVEAPQAVAVLSSTTWQNRLAATPASWAAWSTWKKFRLRWWASLPPISVALLRNGPIYGFRWLLCNCSCRTIRWLATLSGRRISAAPMWPAAWRLAFRAPKRAANYPC